MGDLEMCLAEQNLADHRGHCYAYIKALADCLVGRGVPVRTLCHRSVLPEIASAVHGEGHFSWRFNGRYPQYFRVGRHVLSLAQRVWFRHVHRRFLADLNGLPDDLRPQADTVCYFSTLISPEVLAVASWLRGLPVSERPRVAVMLRFRPNEPYLGCALSERFYARALRELVSLDEGGRIALFSDSDLLAERYAPLAGRSVGVLPIPHSFPPALEGTSASGREAASVDGTLRFAFLGRAAPEKGFGFLPDIFEPFRDDIDAGRLELMVQGPSPQDGGPDSPMGRAAQRLRAMGAVILPSPLSPEAYREALRDAHVVVLPYDTQSNEYLGTSGVFTEAVALGKPVITAAGTWMARRLTDLGLGLAVAGGTIAAYREAVSAILANPASFLAGSQSVTPSWRRLHSPDSVVDCLLAGFGEAKGKQKE